MAYVRKTKDEHQVQDEKILESGNLFEIQRMIDEAISDGWKMKKMGYCGLINPNACIFALMVRDGE